MLRRKESFTVITPIPGFIPRQLAIDILHSHSEVITLNPLVLEHKPIAAPQNAETDEYYSTWYEITERIQYVPGLGKMGSGIIKFNGCFHDMPWGLQTHIYAPMNVDLRNTYRIAGNQPGIEPPETPEIGMKSLGVPADGLYLREDIEIKANITVIKFVKSELQKAGKEMVGRIIKKAELLDAGVLQAMIEDGKLKTVNPADRRNTTLRSPLPSPVSLHHSPSVLGTPPPQSPRMPYQIPRPQSYQAGFRPGSAGPQSGYPNYPTQQQATYPYGQQVGVPMELPASEPAPNNHFAAEMPGDFYYTPQHPGSQPSPAPSSQHRDSTMSATSDRSRFSPDPQSQTGQWSTLPANSRPNSLSSNASGNGNGMYSPGLDHKGFSSELSTHKETNEEHYRDEALRKLDPRIPHPSHYPPYNPQDYANQVAQQQQQQQKQMQAGGDYKTLPSQRYNYTQ
ncbi:hypothetical protein QBC46DRAFT_401118 [Diplogelasinospora grovesii]|uniref:DUF7053 domain-containing protein n=1 Tax=Diplogelasinospora grovesii TaxID=303347 RepID=A0AAN6MUT1_9PEZI|nr:hypothetical protein QBC46DRAFT_401118 [Diplogelasinospora grovesii]